MYYPTPNELPPPDEAQRSRDAVEAEAVDGRQATREMIQDTAVSVAGVAVGASVGVGLYASSAQKREAFVGHNNTLAALEIESEFLYDQIATVPQKMRVTHEGRDLSARIDNVNTMIADTKYNYQGGVRPEDAMTVSMAAGVLAAAVFIVRGMDGLTAQRNARTKV